MRILFHFTISVLHSNGFSGMLEVVPAKETDMQERRKTSRRDLMFYSRVRDGISGRQVGNLLNITVGGAMVLCDRPIEPQIVMELHIELPDGIAVKSELVVTATSLWHQADINPEFYDVGFQFHEVDPADHEIIQRLIKEYGFRQQ